VSDWAPSEEQVRAMRAKWRGDIGAAAKDVEKLCDWLDAALQSEGEWKDIALHCQSDEKAMRETLGVAQARCSELLLEVRSLKEMIVFQVVQGPVENTVVRIPAPGEVER
jgi:hypothetical protein